MRRWCFFLALWTQLMLLSFFWSCRRHRWHWTKDKVKGYNFFFACVQSEIGFGDPKNMFLCPVIIAYKSQFSLKFRYEKNIEMYYKYISSYRFVMSVVLIDNSCHHHLKYTIFIMLPVPTYPPNRFHKCYSKLRIRNGFSLVLLAPLFNWYPAPLLAFSLSCVFRPW